MVEALFHRRSIRKYSDLPVREEEVKKLLKAAMAAPSAGNQQPWEFIVIKDKNIMLEITRFHSYSQMLKEARLAIVVCGDPQREIKHSGYWIQDCAAATENILIEAQYLKIGSVWLGVYPEEDRVRNMRKLLNIPDNIIPFSIISLGYPAETKNPSDRFDAQRIHINKW